MHTEQPACGCQALALRIPMQHLGVPALMPTDGLIMFGTPEEAEGQHTLRNTAAGSGANFTDERSSIIEGTRTALDVVQAGSQAGDG